MALKILQFAICFGIATCRRDYIDGKYHNGIRDFHLLVPHSCSSQGRFETFHLNQFFEHDFQSRRIQKRLLDDPDIVHYGIWINNKLKQLDLWPNREFLNPNLIFETLDEMPVHKREIKNLVGRKLCYYTGNVHDYPDSTASISTCDGLLGNIRVENTDYFIEPIKGYGPNDEGHHLHVIYDLTKKMYRKKRNSQHSSWCAVQDNEDDWDSSIKERIKDSILKKGKLHTRENIANSSTSLNPKYMETTIVCDKTLIAFHKGHRDLDVYILTAVNTQNKVGSLYEVRYQIKSPKDVIAFSTAFNAFRDASFGSDMTLSLVRVIYLEKEGQDIDLNVSISIENTLASFNLFADRINFPEDNPLHHDVAMLASRVDMCSGANLTDCVVCGVAKIGGVCKTNSSANVAEDDGIYELAMTMTHEAGHLLGITHDGADGLGKPCKNPTNSTGRPKVWIMSVVDPNAVYFGWSECSRAMSGSFMRNGWADCMNDESEKTNKKFAHVPIGVMYGRNEQCYLSTIRKGKQFEADKTCGDPSECENLYCQYYGKDKGCKTMNHMVADGTPCGEDKWCWNSKCVQKGQRPDAVDGGWSDWSGWSECSRTCGGGIQITQRTCDNPQQSGGGRYCQGDKKKVKLCNLESCEISARNQVCKQQFKGVALFLQKNPCQIACLDSKEKLVWSNLTVPNGEACEWGRKPSRRCIFGECVKIGCDNDIESNAMTDDCGICNGETSSCTVIEGRWKQKRNNGSLTQNVTIFPKMSFNIKIIEATSYRSKISLLSADMKTVYINDYEQNHNNSSIDGLKKFQDGVEGYLSTNGFSENVTIEGPIKENLLFKVVYLEEDADFKWKYSILFGNETVSKEERNYRWEQDGWTECSKVCGGGIQTSTFNCVEEKLGKVADNLCVGQDSPDLETKACKEQPCKTRWKVGQWGDCHACKEKSGMRARGVECMQENPEKAGDDVLVEDEKCEESKPHKYMLCSPKSTPTGPRKKRCTLGLPERYMDQVWSQLNYIK